MLTAKIQTKADAQAMMSEKENMIYKNLNTWKSNIVSLPLFSIIFFKFLFHIKNRRMKEKNLYIS